MRKLTLCTLLLMMLVFAPVSIAKDKHSKTHVPDKEVEADENTDAIYHMDGTGTNEPDDTEHGNHGVSIGADPDEDGVFGKSKKFKGTDFIAISNNNFTIGNNFSLSLFVKIPHYPSGNSTFFSSTENSTSIIWFGIVGTSLFFSVQDDNGTFHNLSSTTPVPLHKWIHVSAIFNGADDFMGVYQDGDLMSGGSIPNNDHGGHDGNGGNINCHQDVHHTNNSTVTQICVQNMENSTIMIGATYINQTDMYLEGNVDELVIYNADMVVIYGNYTNITNINNTYITQEQIVIGLALGGLLLFLLIMGMVFSSGIAVTSPFIASLISALAGIVITVALVMMFPLLSTLWAMVFFLFGSILLILYVLMRSNRIDFVNPGMESNLLFLLPISSLIFFGLGGIDLLTGIISHTYPPFWVN